MHSLKLDQGSEFILRVVLEASMLGAVTSKALYICDSVFLTEFFRSCLGGVSSGRVWLASVADCRGTGVGAFCFFRGERHVLGREAG